MVRSLRGRGVLFALWLVAVGGGFSLLAAYKSNPAPRAPAPAHWPGDSTLSPPAGRLRIVLFIHPHCPCSQATLRELERCLAAHPAVVVFVKPAGVADGWERGSLWDFATAIPGVTAFLDVGGREAQRFGATTSGQCLVYAAAGDLLFSGGLTPARGHEGDNPGRAAVAALIAGRASPCTAAPVFGCPLLAPCDRCQEASACRS